MTRVPERLGEAATGQPRLRGRLTDVERAERAMNQAELQDLITDLAVLHGWEWLHVRPGMKANGRWWTATTGTLSRWPDLVLVRERDRRLIFAELVKELGSPTPEQRRVLAVLDTLTTVGIHDGSTPSIETYVWRPSDLRDPIEDSVIGRCLR